MGLIHHRGKRVEERHGDGGRGSDEKARDEEQDGPHNGDITERGLPTKS